jgi:excisionase family DNA binding protein
MTRSTETASRSGATDEIRLISADELAKMLDVSTRTVWRLLSTGQLVQPVRLGGSVRWRLDEVKVWINNGCPVVTR